MKLPVGFPFFNPPHVQKVTAVEEGNFFVPTEGVDAESATQDLGTTRTKVGKIVKIVLIAAAVITFVVLGVLAFLDPGPIPPITP